MRTWSARVSLLGRFFAMGFVVVAVLGLVIGFVLKQRIEQRVLDGAVQHAQVITQLGVQPHLVSTDLSYPNSLERLNQLDRELGARFFDDVGIVKVKLFNRDGRLVYSDDRSIIGDHAFKGGNVYTALKGEVVRNLEHGTADTGNGERTLEVYVPVRLAPAGKPSGVLELYLSYEPTAKQIREDVLALAIMLGGGLVVLFAVLFRIVAGASRRLRHQALHDALTGLPNRSLLNRRAERALRGDETAAMLLIDLDRFKEVNDTLGHDYGDALLVEVSERLGSALRRGDTLARLGGDEFAVLVDRTPDRAAAIELAGRLRDALRRPFALREVAVELEASIGVAFYPEHGTTAGALLQRADVAMYEAKRGRHGVATYSAERDPYSADRLGLLAELRRAIEHDELVLHYQPKISLRTGELTGVEALVRWQHPTRGLLAPDEFVPLAARTGAVADLTRWVVDHALAQHREWRDAGVDVPVAVNLAAANIVDVTLPAAIGELLARHDVEAGRLACEISEHTVMADPVRAADVLGGLRGLGVRLSLDDFGTGHSSLAYLKRLPLDEVKIDRSFVAGMTDDENDAVIVRSTIDLARNLGLEVVAEGVETETIMHGLADLRCDTAQGFYISRPLPAGELDLQALSVSLRGPARNPSSSSTAS
ncbi:MAG TPA: EAL domain-containing protein [Solirubrobacteraceae bacterium]|nr:EAL domain-containing protein [Solirubrobacteraceae bacterium]